jgi:hypothetical protein
MASPTLCLLQAADRPTECHGQLDGFWKLLLLLLLLLLLQQLCVAKGVGGSWVGC